MSVRPEDIRFIFYLPNLSAYRDRANLVGHIARKVGRGVLVTSRADVPAAEIGIQDLEVVEVAPGGRFPGRTALAASRAVGKLLRDHDYNVVHDTFGHLLPLFWRRRRHPGQAFVTSLYILAEWDLRRWIWPRYHMRALTHPNLRLSLMRALSQRSIIRASDTVVVQAPGLVDRLVEFVPSARGKVTWIPNNVVSSGVGAEPQRPTARPRGIRLLYVGGFAVGKGAERLLVLLARARARGIAVEAHAVGTSSPLELSQPVDHRYLRKRIEEEGLQNEITFHMRVDRAALEGFYADADWLFHHTRIDGSPRVILEALVRGLPVVGSRHPGVEVLDPGGEFILFSDPFDPDAVLDSLVAANADPGAHLTRAAAGRRHVEENHSSEAVSERYVELYSRVLAGRSP